MARCARLWGVNRIISPCPLPAPPPHATQPRPVLVVSPVVPLTIPSYLPFPPPLLPCQNGLTPLGMAAYSRGGMGVLKVLLAAGASADIADKVSRWLLAAPTVAREQQG